MSLGQEHELGNCCATSYWTVYLCWRDVWVRQGGVQTRPAQRCLQHPHYSVAVLVAQWLAPQAYAVKQRPNITLGSTPNMAVTSHRGPICSRRVHWAARVHREQLVEFAGGSAGGGGRVYARPPDLLYVVDPLHMRI